MSTTELIAAKVKDLKPDEQERVLHFIESLEAPPQPRKSAWGFLPSRVDITSEETDELRREMWSGFPRDDI